MITRIDRDPILGREEIADLIDDLPDSELHSVKRYLQFMGYLDDPETLVKVEALAILDGLKPRGRPDKMPGATPVDRDELKNLLAGIEDYRLPPASWFIRFTHATSADTSKELAQKGQPQ